MKAKRQRWPVLLVTLGLVLAATLPYVPNLRGYFLGDDFGLVSLFADKPTFHVLTLFTNPWTEAVYGIRADELRPTVALSYQFDSLWGADNPLGYHLASLVYHVLNVLQVAAIARLAGRASLIGAAFAGLLFAVLPIHAETVSWISGRADSIPALFYLTALFGYVLWRRNDRRWWYIVALGAFFLALFSKQSAITMVATLVGYDLLVQRRPISLRLSSLRPYLPFAGLTLGYLGLRYILFGNAVREQQITQGLLLEFLAHQTSFLKTLLLGSSMFGADRVPPWLGQAGLLLTWLGLLVALGLAAFQVLAVQRGRGSALAGRLVYFGPVWWFIGIAPLAVTYESPRHLYLAAVGPVILLAVLFDLAWQRRGALRVGVAVAALVLVTLATGQLQRHLAEWRGAAYVSGQVATDLRRELPATPAGSLVVLGLPVAGPNDRIHTWILAWAIPFVLEPPFQPMKLLDRIGYVAAPDVFCCPRRQWLDQTRRAVTDWSLDPGAGPVLVLRWNSYSAAMIRETEADLPDLRGKVLSLAEAPTPAEMCRRLNLVLGNIGASCTDQ